MGELVTRTDQFIVGHLYTIVTLNYEYMNRLTAGNVFLLTHHRLPLDGANHVAIDRFTFEKQHAHPEEALHNEGVILDVTVQNNHRILFYLSNISDFKTCIESCAAYNNDHSPPPYQSIQFFDVTPQQATPASDLSLLDEAAVQFESRVGPVDSHTDDIDTSDSSSDDEDDSTTTVNDRLRPGSRTWQFES